MCTDFQGFKIPLLNNKNGNVQKRKRFFIMNCAAIPQKFKKKFLQNNKNVYSAPTQVKWIILSRSVRLLLAGMKIIF